MHGLTEWWRLVWSGAHFEGRGSETAWNWVCAWGVEVVQGVYRSCTGRAGGVQVVQGVYRSCRGGTGHAGGLQPYSIDALGPGLVPPLAGS